MNQDNIDYIKKTLEDLEQYCRQNGFKCGLSFGGGIEYSGGLMEWDHSAQTFVQKTEQHLVRTFSNLSFRVTLKDTDYNGEYINLISEAAKDIFRALNDQNDFDAHEND